MPNAVSFETNSNFHPNWKRTRSSVEMDMWLITFVTSIIYEQWKTTQANGFPIVMCRWSCCCCFFLADGWLVLKLPLLSLSLSLFFAVQNHTWWDGSVIIRLYLLFRFLFSTWLCVCIFVLCFASDDFFSVYFYFPSIKKSDAFRWNCKGLEKLNVFNQNESRMCWRHTHKHTARLFNWIYLTKKNRQQQQKKNIDTYNSAKRKKIS